jgi:hypothetical protein
VRIVTRWEIQNKSIVLRACSKFSCSISTDNEIANFFVRTNKILQLMEISFGSWKADVGKQISFRKKKSWVAFLKINWQEINYIWLGKKNQKKN